jgi:hypothetical protein
LEKTLAGKTIFQLMRDKVIVSLSLVWKDGEANKFQFYKQNKLCFETVYWEGKSRKASLRFVALHNFAYSRHNNWIPHAGKRSLSLSPGILRVHVCMRMKIHVYCAAVHIHPSWGQLVCESALKVGAIDCISFVAATAAINFECPVDVSGGGGCKWIPFCALLFAADSISNGDDIVVMCAPSCCITRPPS